jgi:hypothetical protein
MGDLCLDKWGAYALIKDCRLISFKEFISGKIINFWKGKIASKLVAIP